MEEAFQESIVAMDGFVFTGGHLTGLITWVASLVEMFVCRSGLLGILFCFCLIVFILSYYHTRLQRLLCFHQLVKVCQISVVRFNFSNLYSVSILEWGM